MVNKQIYQFPSKKMIPMKVALYLLGQGPYREPRIIEMQYFRISRYCEALEEKLETEIDIKKIYIDINFPRTEDLEKLSNLQVLLNDVRKQNIDTVIVDICHGEGFQQNKYTPIIWTIESTGAKVYNCYYDDENALITVLTKWYGKNVHSYMLPNDREEFLELFPALAAGVTYEVLKDWLSRIPTGNNDPFINYVLQKIDFMRNENPYNRSSLPWLSDKKISELYQLKKEELDKRRLTEETYILGPEQTGKLLDEDITRLRGQESFEWILNRLKDLGFNHYINNKEHTFIMEYNGYILYADPREEGSIEIFIYKKETEEKITKKKRNRNNVKNPIGNFKMQDGWKNNLKAKFINRVEKIIH